MRTLCLIISVMITCMSSVSAAPVTISLKEVRLADLAQVVFGDLLKRSYIFDSEIVHAPNDVSVHWQRINLKQADEMMRVLLKEHGFELEESVHVLHIRKSKKIDDDLLIYEVKHRAAKYLSDMLLKVANKDQLGTRGMSAPQGFSSNATEVAGSASQQVDRSALDQIIYACSASECARLKSLLTLLDTPEPNVILRAVIYEVATNQSEGSAIQIAADALDSGNSLGVSMGSMLAGAASLHIKTSGLDAVISSLDSDSRFKSISRPSVRVKTGSTAKFSVGSQVPILGSISYDKNGTPVQSVEYRASGTIFTVSPDIRADSIDLQVMQELSSFAVTTSGVNNSPTLLQRTSSSTLTLRDREVVVFAGLEEEKDDDAKSKLWGFIPLSSKSSNSKSEILIFIEAQRI